MQVQTKRMINDKESVVLGLNRIIDSYQKLVTQSKLKPVEYYSDYLMYLDIIEDYNGGTSYNNEVADLVEKIMSMFYKDTKDTLNISKEDSINIPE
jgi:hypothetical protein